VEQLEVVAQLVVRQVEAAEEEVVHLQPVMLLDKMVQTVGLVEHQVLLAETHRLQQPQLLELADLVAEAVEAEAQ
jgi:hypothetical protein